MKKPEIHMIFARSMNNVIGYKGNLPGWKIKGDLARFKELTMGAVLIMGRKTWESLPFKLPGRFHIVVTSKPNSADCVVNSFEAALFQAYHCVRIQHAEDWKVECKYMPEPRKIFIIGGASIYKAAENIVDVVHETLVDSENVLGDTFYDTSFLDGSVFKNDYETVPTSATISSTVIDGATYPETEVPAYFFTWSRHNKN